MWLNCSDLLHAHICSASCLLYWPVTRRWYFMEAMLCTFYNYCCISPSFFNLYLLYFLCMLWCSFKLLCSSFHHHIIVLYMVLYFVTLVLKGAIEIKFLIWIIIIKGRVSIYCILPITTDYFNLWGWKRTAYAISTAVFLLLISFLDFKKVRRMTRDSGQPAYCP